ncbi:MAG: diadenylate cyclase [Phycisphaerales bacterium]|jgi:diadenylate cyclase
MLDSLLQSFRGYAWYEIAIEMAIIWVCVYAIHRSLRGTRGAGIIKGAALLLVALILLLGVLGDAEDAFGRIRFLSTEILGLLAIVLAVVFQPELRQAMIRVGQTRFFNRQSDHARAVASAIAESVEYLAKNRFGALLVLERRTGLGGLVEGGVELDALVSARLVETIFYPNSALHDLAVVVRGDRIVAAGVQLPLPEGGVPISPQLGSRHRAAVGLTLESDALVVVVSEETGAVRVAEQGVLSEPIPPGALEARIEAGMIKATGEERAAEAPVGGQEVAIAEASR